MWKVQHAGGQREINELHVPVGRPMRLIMASQDVIHSFFIPAFRIKHDVVPGRYQDALVPAAQARASTICSAPNTAAPTIRGMTGRDRGDGAGRLRAWLAQQDADRHARGSRAARCSGSSAAAAATARAARCTRRRSRASTASRCRLPTARIVIADERYIRDFDPAAAQRRSPPATSR